MSRPASSWSSVTNNCILPSFGFFTALFCCHSKLHFSVRSLVFAAIYYLLKELSRLLDFGMNLLLRLLVGESVAVEDRVPESVDPGKEVACVIDGTRGLPVDN